MPTVEPLGTSSFGNSSGSEVVKSTLDSFPLIIVGSSIRVGSFYGNETKHDLTPPLSCLNHRKEKHNFMAVPLYTYSGKSTGKWHETHVIGAAIQVCHKGF